MLMNGVEDKESVYSAILSELRDVYNLKTIKEIKTKKHSSKVTAKGRIFNVPLLQLQLTDAILVNGAVVQVPKFISCSCQSILNNVDTEGIFRRAGSAFRQKETRAGLENGKSLDKSHSVIDTGDLVKSFFRDLPEPLLAPGHCQENLMACLMLPNEEQRGQALLLACLLLPPITLNTLAFFMQFLNTVSSHSAQNKMTTQNLAIVFTPSLMPGADSFSSDRLMERSKVIELLIENAKDIGIVPAAFLDQQPALTAAELKQKAKKRRSSSVTRFCVNGIKKIVGGGNKRESVDNNLETGQQNSRSIEFLSATPLLTGSKKRKHIEIANFGEMGISAKKKKEIMTDLLTTPLIKDKKKRLSFSSLRPKLMTSSNNRQANAQQCSTIQDTSTSSITTTTSTLSMTTAESLEPSITPPPPLPLRERRWSDTIGTPLAKQHDQQSALNFKSPATLSTPCLTFRDSLNRLDELRIPGMKSADSDDEKDYVRIPKREYEEIKYRMTVIERRISKEFDMVAKEEDEAIAVTSLNRQHAIEANHTDTIEQVQDKYQQALVETEQWNNRSGTDELLAKRLNRDLKIRRSIDQKIIRSPSARKIGTMRRRSRDNTTSRVSRTKSLHTADISGQDQKRHDDNDDAAIFYPKQSSINLKRGRPNTVQSGLRVHRSPPTQQRKPKGRSESTPPIHLLSTDRGLCQFYPEQETWTNAKDFFTATPSALPPMVVNNGVSTPTQAEERRVSLRSASKRPLTTTSIVGDKKKCDGEANLLKTPMLPPKKIPRKTPQPPLSTNKLSHLAHLTPLQQQQVSQQTGRASIARIRSQNAGMVLAKAKLFNDLVCHEYPVDALTHDQQLPVARDAETTTPVVRDRRPKENRRLMSPTTCASFIRKPHIKQQLLQMANTSPRRHVMQKTPARDRTTPMKVMPRPKSPRQRNGPRHF